VKAFCALLCVLALPLAGCITKAKADAQARTAYATGQRDALLSVRQTPSQALTVTVAGDVQNTLIPWTADLTVAKAIVAAGYKGKTDPTNIVIVRNGKGIQVDPQKLLSGQDVPLLPQDVVAIR
jgi:protein involved in polysaccharide export with SLBB domain